MIHIHPGSLRTGGDTATLEASLPRPPPPLNTTSAGTSWTWYQNTEGLGANLDAFLSQTGVAYYDELSSRYPMGGWHVPGNHSLRRNSMTFPSDNGGMTLMVGGEYNCEAMTRYGLSPQNVGKGRHPLRDFENVAHTSLEMVPENIIIDSTDTHIWRTYYWPYYNDPKPIVMEHGAGELWLNTNLGMVVMSYEAINNTVAPRPPQCLIDVLSDAAGRETGVSLPKQQSTFYTMGFDGFAYPMPNAGGKIWPRPNPYVGLPNGKTRYQSPGRR